MPGAEETGRFRQRRRTRAAIVAAATELLRGGVTPSIVQIAEAADVSRRTVYQYFPTLEQLLVDATLGLLSQDEIDEAIDSADVGGEADARVVAMVRALATSSSETLPLGRQVIRLTVDAPDSDNGPHPRRGYRRVAWIERALEPLRPQLDPAGFDRLVSALAVVVGWEALIVLTDVRGLDLDQRLDVTLWSARALVREALAQAE